MSHQTDQGPPSGEPTREELQAFLNGRLPSGRYEEIAALVAGSPKFQAALAELDASACDSLVEELRDRSRSELCDDAQRGRAIELVLSLRKPVPQADAPSAGGEGGFALPQRLGQYELLSKLGAGGMGTVYRARHLRLEKQVALKVLPASLLKDSVAVGRFEREMRAVGKLSHPNIVAAHDAGDFQGTHYLVMELVEGIDLSRLSHRLGPLPTAEACELVRQAAGGLDHAHRRGLVHRDIKPSNLMLARTEEDQPIVKILDMGLALLDDGAQAGEGELTTAGQMMGTVEYMAPEQGLDSHEVDIRADIYALGATLFKLLTGAAPFPREKYDTVLKLMMAKTTGTAPSLAEKSADLPAELVALVDRMLAREPRDRPARPAEVVEALTEFSAGAHLARLLDAASVDRQAETAVDHSAMQTQEHLSRSSHETSPDAAPQHRPLPIPTPSRLRKRRKPHVALAVGLGAILLAGILLYLRTPHGTLIVEVDDPAIKVAVDGGALEITEADHGQPIRVTAGEHTLHVTRGDLKFETQQFTLARGKEVRLRVELAAGSVRVVQDGAVIGKAEVKLAPPTVASADANYALSFDGQTSYVAAPSLKYDGSHPITIEGWFVSHNTTRPVTEHLVWRTIAGWEQIIQLHVGDNTNEGEQMPYGAAVTPNLQIVSDYGMNVRCGTRFHAALVWDGKQLEVYVNGQSLPPARPLEAIINHSGKKGLITTNFCLGSAIRNEAGRNQPDPATAPFFEGAMDEVRISRVARYVENFTPAARFEPDEHTLALYHFDEGTGDVLHDASGNGHDGKIVGARWVKGAAASTESAESREAWLARVSPLPRKDREREVAAELKRRNPGFTGSVKFEQWNLTETRVVFEDADAVCDLSPLRAFPDLTSVTIPRLHNGHLPALLDLASLRGLPIHTLHLPSAGLPDLEICREFPLRYLFCWYTAVCDLTPLRGKELTYLNIQRCAVRDLAPLRGMPLRELDVTGNAIDDLTPLKGMPLESLRIDFRPYRGIEVIRDMPTLKQINEFRPGEFWSNYNRQLGPDPKASPPLDGAWVKRFASLSSQEQEQTLLAELKRRNPGFEGSLVISRFQWGLHVSIELADHVSDLTPLQVLPNLAGVTWKSSYHERNWFPLVRLQTLEQLQGMKLRTLAVRDSRISELSPLRDMPLELLDIAHTYVSDLAPLRGLPLHNLALESTYVADLSPLTGMPLETLRIVGCPHVVDLSPLADMPLKHLTIQTSGVTDLTPLQDLPLAHLEMDLKPYAGIEHVRAIKSLQTINYKPASEYWRRYDAMLAGSTLIEPPALASAIPAAKQAEGVLRELKRLNPEFTGELKYSIENEKVVEWTIHGGVLLDLSPLLQLKDLKRLAYPSLQPQRDAPVLREMASLEKINWRSAADFRRAFAAMAPQSVVDNDWMERVSSLPVHDQVKSVVQKLKELNPGYEGNVAPNFKQDRVTSFHLLDNSILTNISPLKALPNLEHVSFDSPWLSDLSPLAGMNLTRLGMRGTYVSDLSPLKGMKLEHLDIWGTPVSDLSPLRGMPLTRLCADYTRISDLSPLAGMPLTELSCGATQVTDLSPLKGMKLTSFGCGGTRVSDLSPLRGMPLTLLHCHASTITDLSPLAGMPLKELSFYFDSGQVSPQDIAMVRGMATLETINNKPAAEYWKEYDAAVNRRVAKWVLDVGGTVVVRLPSGEQKVSATEGSLPEEAFEVTRVELYSIEGLKDDDLARLETLRGLKWLILSDTPALTDACMEHIGQVDSLFGLVLVDVPLSADGFKPLTRLKGLGYLDLVRLPNVAGSLPTIAEMPALELLGLKEVDLEGAWCEPLKKAPRLRHLVLSLPQISDESWQSLLTLEQLESLNFTGVCDVPPQRLRQLSQLPQLTTLKFQDHGVVDRQLPTLEQLQAVAELKQLKCLKLLKVSVSAESLAALAPLDLEELSLAGTRLEDVDLAAVKQMQRLKVLEIQKTGLSAESVAELRQALPNCTIRAE